MKLLTFQPKGKNEIIFGIYHQGWALSFDALQRRRGQNRQELKDVHSYLENLPGSETLAKELCSTLEDISSFGVGERFSLDSIRILPAVPRPPAIFDFGLSPRHLLASSLTMNRYERKFPARLITSLIIKRQFRRLGKRPNLRFDKGNHHSIIGDWESPYWPPFTSYFDLEPELAIVAGYAPLGLPADQITQAIAGYVIFNDFSARDIQWPEMLGMLGPSRSKDFERGNALGPFLVTPDEVPDPLSLKVTVKIGNRFEWQGSTQEYSAHPFEVMKFLTSFRSVAPGTIIGMGTVPNCCGLDRDEWVLPGELIEITFDRLGTLHHHLPKKIGPLKPTRWKPRPELKQFQ